MVTWLLIKWSYTDTDLDADTLTLIDTLIQWHLAKHAQMHARRASPSRGQPAPRNPPKSQPGMILRSRPIWSKLLENICGPTDNPLGENCSRKIWQQTRGLIRETLSRLSICYPVQDCHDSTRVKIQGRALPMVRYLKSGSLWRYHQSSEWTNWDFPWKRILRFSNIFPLITHDYHNSSIEIGYQTDEN